MRRNMSRALLVGWVASMTTSMACKRGVDSSRQRAATRASEPDPAAGHPSSRDGGMPGTADPLESRVEGGWAKLPAASAVVDMVHIPGGDFYGIRMKSFEIDRREVTVDSYRACVEAGACFEPASGGELDNWRNPARLRHPVNQVDWNLASTFCAWRGARLPTESEWEWSAQGRDGERPYPWGDEEPSCDRAIMAYPRRPPRGSVYGCGAGGTWPVGSRSPAGDTRDGVGDMAGNVWEWTRSWFDAEEEVRVIRGGGWVNANTDYFHVAYRDGNHPSGRNHLLGFRCVRTVG